MNAVEDFRQDYFQLRPHLERFLSDQGVCLDSRLKTGTQNITALSQQQFSWDAPDEFYRETVGDEYLFDLADWHMTSADYIEGTVKLINDYAQGRVLDFGGGIGTHTLAAALCPQVEQVIYCDINPANRAFVAKRIEWMALGSKVTICDRLPDTHFNTIICFDVLEHLPDPVAQLQQFHQILQPEGKLIANWYFHKGIANEFPLHLDDPQVVRQFMTTLQRLFLEEFHPHLVTARCYSKWETP